MELFNSTFRIYSGVLSATCCFSLALLAFFRKENKRTINYFILSNLMLGGWNISELLTSHAPKNWVLISDRLSYLFALFLVPSFFLLVHSIERKENRKFFNAPKFLIASMILFIPLTISPLIIKDVITEPKFIEVPGKAYPAFIAYFFLWLIYGLFQMFKIYRDSEGYQRNQMKYLFLSLSIALIASINYFIYIFDPSFPPLFHVIVIAYSFTVAYAVIRYRLMDFNLLVRWGLAYGTVVVISILFSFGSMLLTERIMRNTLEIPGIPTLIGISVLILLYEPLRKKTVDFIDHFIFQSPDLKEILRGISEEINSVDDLESFSANLSKKLKSIWKVDHAGLVTWDPQSCKFIPRPTSDFTDLAINSKDFSITPSDFLIKTLEQERRLFEYGIVVDDEVDILSKRSSRGERATFWKIKRSMRWLGAKVCVPVISDSQIVGFFVLGNKQSGSIYNREDKKFLSHLSGLTSGLIKNFVFGSQVEKLEFRRT